MKSDNYPLSLVHQVEIYQLECQEERYFPPGFSGFSAITCRVVQSLFQQYDRSPRRVIVNKNQASRSEYEAKKEVAATIEDEDEEDKEIMEVLGAEEVDTELDYEVDSEATKKEREANI